MRNHSIKTSLLKVNEGQMEMTGTVQRKEKQSISMTSVFADFQ